MTESHTEIPPECLMQNDTGIIDQMTKLKHTAPNHPRGVGYNEGVEACLAMLTCIQTKLLKPDMPAQELRLHMGELTADEMRVARAAIRWANATVLHAHDEKSQSESQCPADLKEDVLEKCWQCKGIHPLTDGFICGRCKGTGLESASHQPVNLSIAADAMASLEKQYQDFELLGLGKDLAKACADTWGLKWE